jgi:hypothetical protein
VGNLTRMIRSSQTHEALDRIQATHRDRLRLLSRTDAAPYIQLGDAIGERRGALCLPRHQMA